MQDFLMGTTAMGCWTAMLFFLRFWRESGDRLFGNVFCILPAFGTYTIWLGIVA